MGLLYKKRLDYSSNAITIHAMTKGLFKTQAGLLLGMFFLAAAFFYSHFFTKIYITLGDDWCVFYAPAFFFKKHLAHGILPLWNPDVGFGIPEGIGVSPLALHRLLLFFMSPRIVWNFLNVFNFIFSGWLLSLYLLRRLGVLFPAFLGGLMISVAQLNVAICGASFFLFVLSFLLADRLVILKSYSAGILLSISLLAFSLNTVPQPVICAYSFLFCYILIRFRLHRNFDFHLWLVTVFPFLMALMLFSPQIFRIKELLDLSLRTKIADKEVFSILPWDYFQMIWPNNAMNSQNPALNFISGSMITAPT